GVLCPTTPAHTRHDPLELHPAVSPGAALLRDVALRHSDATSPRFEATGTGIRPASSAPSTSSRDRLHRSGFSPKVRNYWARTLLILRAPRFASRSNRR